MSCNKEHKTSIGGQAVIEGVMMRGPKLIATSVRKPDGDIVTDIKPVKLTSNKIAKLPIIRGCVNFFASMVTGVKCLMFSAEFFDIEEEKEGYDYSTFKFCLISSEKIIDELGWNPKYSIKEGFKRTMEYLNLEN